MLKGKLSQDGCFLSPYKVKNLGMIIFKKNKLHELWLMELILNDCFMIQQLLFRVD